jgi:adenine phosphoribosyltransferase
MAKTEFIKSKIRKVPDFPKEGILYYDITTLLSDAHALRFVINEMVNYFIENNLHFDKIVSAESRGFIFGAILAKEMHSGFVPIRKAGKLPFKKIAHEYQLEYGNDTLEIHEDAIEHGDTVLVVDDLLATGGTALAAAKLVEQLGGTVKCMSFLIELSFLKGRDKLKKYNIFSLINFDKPE